MANDAGGVITQFVLARRPERVGGAVFTNCDTVGRYPPAPYNWIFAAVRRPSLGHAVFAPLRWTPIRQRLGFGALLRRPDPATTRAWVTPYLTNPAIRADLARFSRGIDPVALEANVADLGRYDRPVLLVWGTADRFFRLQDARGLAASFPNSTLVEIDRARTFVSLDEPDEVATHIGRFVASDEPSSP